MESYYEINVSCGGRFFFATAPRSARNRQEMEQLVATFRRKFTEANGYKVSVTHWECVGHSVNV